jgi:hypothetical protein
LQVAEQGTTNLEELSAYAIQMCGQKTDKTGHYLNAIHLEEVPLNIPDESFFCYERR